MCIFSAYEDDNGNLVYKPQDVILNYLQGWFVFDLLASIPFEYIMESKDCYYRLQLLDQYDQIRETASVVSNHANLKYNQSYKSNKWRLNLK